MNARHNNRPVPVVIDTDPGVDDAVAILMLLSDPSFDGLGFTTTAGNVPLARSTRNSLALLEHIGRSDIPVCRGAARPIRGRYAYARQVHSASGLTRRMKEPDIGASNTKAIPFLATTLSAHPGEVTLIALGPLTNLARLWRSNPDALRAAGRIVVMGGAVNARGNASPHAEFNFYSDPTAAKVIFDSGLPLTLIDLAACQRVAISRAQAETVRSGSKMGTLAAELLEGWFARDSSRQQFYLYDPLAVLAVTHPQVVGLNGMTVRVVDSDDTDDSAMWGKCEVVDANQGPIQVVAPGRVDSDAAWAAIKELLDWE